ncbi:hypothetical protein A0257_23200 (plasmid) [Hymenobacter psoromatis]|nr:hypothetical protein A0257_23200 [Hymenobacter psoromatis]
MGAQVFRGDAGNPLLAPRGVWLTGQRLLVADTGQNRVFIWNQLPTSEFAAPDVVLGQLELLATGRNSGHQAAAGTLHYPSGLWSDGTRLLIADAWNHRVLIWHTFPTRHGQPADVVVGQADFHGSQPNEKGIGSLPTATSLNWPYGVFSDGQRLWIADTGNRRVLCYHQIPTQNHAAADAVIGKDSFTGRDYESAQPVWPYAVRVSPAGQLLIADTQYYRALLWHDWRTAPHQPADVLIGQPDFEANGQNQYRLYPEANTLSWVYDAFFHQNQLLIADTGNSRLLWFDQVPTANNAAADNLLGHADFGISSENATTRFGTDRQLYWPFSLCAEDRNLAVADTGNHRIILYKLPE